MLVRIVALFLAACAFSPVWAQSQILDSMAKQQGSSRIPVTEADVASQLSDIHTFLYKLDAICVQLDGVDKELCHIRGLEDANRRILENILYVEAKQLELLMKQDAKPVMVTPTAQPPQATSKKVPAKTVR